MCLLLGGRQELSGAVGSVDHPPGRRRSSLVLLRAQMSIVSRLVSNVPVSNICSCVVCPFIPLACANVVSAASNIFVRRPSSVAIHINQRYARHYTAGSSRHSLKKY